MEMKIPKKLKVGSVDYEVRLVQHCGTNDDFGLWRPQGIKTIPITKEGKYILYYDGECTLFPDKDQRDWSKFERFWDKPKVERFDPKTFQPFDKVLGRDTNDNCWIALFFGHIGKGSHRAVCGYFSWTQCIPYNEETKHLVGTSDDCPEYYKWWEDE